MQIYSYHPESKVFLGSTLADESPLEPGVFLVPAYATQTAPPPIPEGKVAVWVQNLRWDIIDRPAFPGLTLSPSEENGTAPNFGGFLDSVIASPLYQKVLEQSVASSAVNVAFTSTMGALILAANGRPNGAALQSGLNSLLASMVIEPEDLESLQQLITQARLSEIIILPN